MGGSRSRRVALALYEAFGLTIASDYPLTYAKPSTDGHPDLTFHCTNRRPVEGESRDLAPIFSSASEIGEGISALRLYRASDYEVVSFTDVAEYYLWPDRIICHLLDSAYEYAVELYLFGLVFALWLERRGVLALHGSAVAIGDRAIAILGGKHSGKTTLAAALLKRGYSLLTDDVLILEAVGDRFLARPTYPEMRVWPDQAAYFFTETNGAPRVHPKSPKLRISLDDSPQAEFCNARKELRAIYVPDSADTERVTISPVTGARAVVTLVANSYAPYLVEAMGLQYRRFAQLARIAEQIPVRHLVYPRGLERLRDAAAAIVEDRLT